MTSPARPSSPAFRSSPAGPSARAEAASGSSAVHSACQYVADNLVYLEGVLGELIGMALEVGALAQASDLGVDDLRSRLSELARSLEAGALAEEVPGAIQQSLEGIDVIVENLGHPRGVAKVAPAAAADVVRGETLASTNGETA